MMVCSKECLVLAENIMVRFENLNLVFDEVQYKIKLPEGPELKNFNKPCLCSFVLEMKLGRKASHKL